MLSDPELFLRLAESYLARPREEDGHLYRYDRLGHFQKIRDHAFRLRNWRPEPENPCHNHTELGDAFQNLRQSSSLFRICFFNSKIDAFRYWLAMAPVDTSFAVARVERRSLLSQAPVQESEDLEFGKFSLAAVMEQEMRFAELKVRDPRNPVFRRLALQSKLLSGVKASIFYIQEPDSPTNSEFSDTTIPFNICGALDQSGNWKRLRKGNPGVKVRVLNHL